MPRQRNSTDIIPIENLNMGGLSFSKWSGRKNSVYRMIGFDPHSIPGILTVEPKMTAETDVDAPDELCKVALYSSNGSSFWFSSESGKIWERPSDGNWRLVHTTTPAAGEAKCLGAAEYQGRIWWFTQSRGHWIAVSDADDNDWASDATEDAITFGVTDSEYHPTKEVNLVLYIGDGNQVAQIDGTTFSANALDVEEPLRIKSLGQFGTDLLIGTIVDSDPRRTMIIRWDTYSVSFTNSDPVPEVGINAFLDGDNMVLVSAGYKGNIYYYDGVNLELYLKIPGDYSGTNKAEIYPNSVAQINGHILFGYSNNSGNPADQLIYRLGRHSRDFDYILDQPYPTSERSSGEFVLSNLNIGAIVVIGTSIYVSWKNTSSAACEVDALDTAKLDGAYIESRVAYVNRESFANFSKACVFYSSLPTDTDFDMFLDVNYAGYGSTALTKVDDTDRNMIESKDESREFTTLQLKIQASVTGSTGPEMESAAIFLK